VLPILYIIFAIVLLIAIVAVWIFNRLVRLRNRYLGAFAQIDVQVRRRYNLVPSLVEVVKGYMAHERGTLESVVAARSAALAAHDVVTNDKSGGAMKSMASAEGNLSTAVTQLLAVAEAYPQLKANEQAAKLMEELTGTENRISFARQFFNDCVMEYNSVRDSFPAPVFAGVFGFTQAEFCEIDAVERAVPAV